MKYLKVVFCTFTLLVYSITTGCGSKNENNSTNIQMGGTVQGKELVLTGSVTTFAGSPVAALGSDDGMGLLAQFADPYDITTDGINLYVADGINKTIRKIVISTGAVTTLAGTAGVWGLNDGVGAAASFNFTRGITTDGKNLYVTDTGLIRKIEIASGTVTTLAGSTSGSIDGIGTAAQFSNYIGGITTDGKNLYVADSSNATIRKVVISTGEVSTLAGAAGIWWQTSDGIGASARFQGPEGITTDGTNLYVADINNTIRKIVISSREVTTLAGTPAQYAGSNGRIVGMTGITTDGTNLYVTSTYTHTIQKLVLSTGVMTTLVGSTGNYGLNDGNSTTARFNYPIGITADGTNLYVTDSANNSIRKLF